MISDRLIYGTVVGTFTLALGVFAFLHQPRRRLSRSFALYTFAAAVSYTTGYAFLIPDHDRALFAYRLSYISLPLSVYFITSFIQELIDSYDERDARRTRATILGATLVLSAIYLTPAVIRDFVTTPDGALAIPGPLYAVNFALLIVALLWLTGNILAHLRSSTGLKRNHLKYLGFCVALAVFGSGARCVSFLTVDRIWTYVVPFAAINVVFAYLILRLELFDFQLWVRRLAVYAGAYSVLIALPFLFLPQLSGYLETPLRMAGLLVVYAAFFSAVTTAATEVIARAERKKWADLHRQLELVRSTAAELAEQRDSNPETVTERVCEAIRAFYWDRTRNPLSFVLVSMVSEREPAIAISPAHAVAKNTLLECFATLQEHPVSRQGHFTRMDLDRNVNPEDLNGAGRLKEFFRANGIEICLPCVHRNMVYGAIFLGPKKRGIFWPEEISAMQTTAHQAAAAVHRWELAKKNRELEDLDQMKRTLITNITHEFKSPLAMIESALQLLLTDEDRRHLDGAKRRELLTLAQDNGVRLGTFIQNLLDLARIQQARVELHRENVEIGALVQRSIERIRSAAEFRGIAVRFLLNGPINGYLDSEKTAQIVDNLLSNALKFTQKGEIAVELEPAGSNARIRVRDSGCGIDPRYLTAIFETFGQAPGTQAFNPKGTGLGLAIAKGWVEAHGGRIRAESNGTGTGSTFVVELPLG